MESNGQSWTTASVIDLQNAGFLLVEDGNHGEYRPRKNEFGDDGVSFIRAADMDNGRVLFESAQKINDTAMSRIRKGIGAGGDVLLSHKGTVGKVAFVQEEAPSFVCSPQTTFWRSLNEEKIDRRYLAAFMNSAAFQAQLFSRQNETDMAGYVSLTAQRALKVILPPIDQQKAIAHILGTLDDKIELNRQINATLEAMAQALFKSWFVDFDPVIDNALAAGNPIPEPLQARAEARKNLGDQRGYVDSFGLPEAIQKQFPNRFVFNDDMGWVPEGWEAGSLSDIATLKTESVNPNKSPGTNWVHYSIPAFDEGMRPVVDLGSEIKSGKYRVPDNCILASKLNPQFPRVWMPEVKDSGHSICSTEFMPFVPKNSLERAFLYALFRSDIIQTEIENRVTGSTGSRQRVKPKEIATLPLTVVPQRLRVEFAVLTQAMFERCQFNQSNSEQLAKLRDTLLPKLLSGQLRIPEAEQQIAKAI